jgi:hypothetical protein
LQFLQNPLLFLSRIQSAFPFQLDIPTSKERSPPPQISTAAVFENLKAAAACPSAQPLTNPLPQLFSLDLRPSNGNFILPRFVF